MTDTEPSVGVKANVAVCETCPSLTKSSYCPQSRTTRIFTWPPIGRDVVSGHCSLGDVVREDLGSRIETSRSSRRSGLTSSTTSKSKTFDCRPANRLAPPDSDDWPKCCDAP